MFGLWMTRFQQPLRVFLCPLKPAPQKQISVTNGDVSATHCITGQPPDVAPVAQNTQPLVGSFQSKNTKARRRHPTNRRCQCHRPGCRQANVNGAPRRGCRVQFDGGTQQGFHHIFIAHIGSLSSSPWWETGHNLLMNITESAPSQ